VITSDLMKIERVAACIDGDNCIDPASEGIDNDHSRIRWPKTDTLRGAAEDATVTRFAGLGAPAGIVEDLGIDRTHGDQEKASGGEGGHGSRPICSREEEVLQFVVGNDIGASS